MERVKFLNLFIDNVSTEEVLQKVDGFISSGGQHQLVAVNAAKAVRSQRDEGLRGIINSCDVIFADGQAVVWASRFLGLPLKQRIAGIDLMHEILRRAAKKGHKVYFLGARHEVVEKMTGVYRAMFPELKIAGWHDGYFKSGYEEQELLKEIKASGPDVLFAAMETPRKEYWIRDNASYLKIPVCMGVGGSFDVITGFAKRAPKWMQKAGLEWFFRFLNEPGRMWKRYLFTNTAFIWLVLKAKFAAWKKKPGASLMYRIIPYVFLAAFSLFPNHGLTEKEKDAWFAFSIPWNYCEGSKADVSFLVDEPAGKHGFITAKDGHFYFENGNRAKFWGVNIHSNQACFPDRGQAEDVARRLRQLGCNIVRMHLLDNQAPMGIIDGDRDDSQHFSETQMEKLDYFIYQLKNNGIYICFDVLGLGSRRFKKGDGAPEFDKLWAGAHGVSFFNKRIIELSKKFALDFLSHVNPYTGKSYLDEPAIAMVEMTNENTLFSAWTRSHISPYYKKEINNIWLEWLKNKKRDLSPGPGHWFDDKEFMFGLQDAYQKDMYSYLRSIGLKSLIGASNAPCDNLVLAADSGMDFTDVHPYWDHVQVENNCYRIHNRPLVKQSHLSPYTIVNMLSMAKVSGKPLAVTEWDSMWPNDWRAVDVLSTASYAGLNDVDALFLYAYNGGWEMSWDKLENKIYYPTVVFNDPAKMGLFPLGALIFLGNSAIPAANVYKVPYGLEHLFRLKDVYIDNARLAGISYVSRLEKIFDSIATDKSASEEIKYPALPELARNKSEVVSDTGQISMDSEKGIFILKTPKVFSFSGFIGGSPVQEFDGVRFFCKSDFATFTIASLDGSNLTESSHLLLAVLGMARNTGQKAAPHLTKMTNDLSRDVYVLNNGKAPILANGIEGDVCIRDNRTEKGVEIFCLDEKGLRKARLKTKKEKGWFLFHVSTAEDKTMYYEIVRE